MPAPSQDVLLAALSKVIDPEIRKPITELDMVSGVTIDSAGNLHLKVHINFQGTGVDSNGGEYTFADQDSFSFNGAAPNTPPFELSMLEQVHLISSGAAQNIIFKATLHTTVRADGTVTAYVDNIRGDEGCVPEANLP